MPKKGQTNNPGGRPKGTPNKVTAEARALFVDILAGEVPHIKEQLEILRREDANLYLKSLSSFMQYFIPKMTGMEVTIKDTEKKLPDWFTDNENADKA